MFKIVKPQTDMVPNSGPTVASRTCMIVGSVTEKAAKTLSERLKKYAHKNSLKTNSIIQIAQIYVKEYGEIEEIAEYESPDEIQFDDETYMGDAYPVFGWACCLADISVDTDTYEVHIDRLIHAVDVGKAINPIIVKGQIEGGTLQALGWALWENVIYKNGRVQNCRMSNSIIPTSMEAPTMETIIIEEPYLYGPNGAKGVGEIPMDGPAVAIANAIDMALIDKWNKKKPDQLPLLPEIIKQLIDEDEQIVLRDKDKLTEPKINTWFKSIRIFFMRLFIFTIIILLLGAIVYLLSKFNPNRYRIQQKSSILYFERGREWPPIGFVYYYPDVEHLKKAYAPVSVPPNFMLEGLEIFNSREDLDHALFNYLSSWIRKLLALEDMDSLRQASYYINRSDHLVLLSSNQQNEIRILKAELAYKKGLNMSKDVIKPLNDAIKQFELSIKLDAKNIASAKEWIAKIHDRINNYKKSIEKNEPIELKKEDDLILKEKPDIDMIPNKLTPMNEQKEEWKL